MSLESCTCGTGVDGFGFIDCYGKPSRVVGIGFQQLKSGSTENYILAPLSQSVWEGWLYNKDGSLRISVLNNLTEYTSERDDAITETIDDIDYYLKDGKKMVSFTVVGAPYKLKAFVEGLRCSKNGFYGLSESNQVLGRRSATNTLHILPIPIQKGTLTSKMIDATNATFSKMMVSFQLDERYDDSEFVYYNAPADVDLLGTEALIQANASATVDSATAITVTLAWSLSGAVGAALEPLTNFDTASFFSLYNETTAASVTISGITESPAGSYELTFVAQTTADVLTLSPSATSPFTFDALTLTAL